MESVSMTVEERQDFLAAVHVAVIAIDRPGRAPLAIPIWYHYEPGGDIKVMIGPQSLKAKLLDASGRFSLCVQNESLPYKYVMVEGPVIETRQCDIEADARVIAHRYLGIEGGDQYIEDGDESTMLTVTMRPEIWYSVDYGKAR